MRLSESLGLEWDDIISDGEEQWHSVRVHTRGGRERVIILADECGVVLSKGRKKKLHQPFPFRSRRAIYQVWVRAKRKAGIEKGYFNTLRTTCAVWHLRSGVPLAEVSRMLGHSSLAMTEELYGEFVPDELEPVPAREEGKSPSWQAEQILRERGQAGGTV
jgi:integrase